MPTQMFRNPVNSAQLTLLRQVLEETCEQHDIPRTSPDGEALAVILLHSLQKGVGEREKLEALASNLAANR